MFNNFDLKVPQIAKFMGPTWGPPWSSRPQTGRMLAPWTLLSGPRFIYRRGFYGIYVGYMALKPSDVTSKYDAISRIETCVADIRIWVNDYFFKLNDDKTELLIITTREELSKISDISVKVGDQSILQGDEPPRILGEIFDFTCCLDAHIAKLCRSNNFNLYSVGRIRKYLDKLTTEKIITATVTSRLDYCNSLLDRAKQSHIDRPQCCQNSAARIISKRCKFDHISPVLRELRCHPVEHRISSNILLHNQKALSGHAPQYLAALISKYVPPRPLRLDGQYVLKMAALNIWKAGFCQGSPSPLEPSYPQREASSIYWLFQD